MKTNIFILKIITLAILLNTNCSIAKDNNAFFTYECKIMNTDNSQKKQDFDNLEKSYFLDDEEVSLALAFFDAKKDIEKQLITLDKAAQNGSNQARYHLGSIYMRDSFSKKDNDRAFEYLNQAYGIYKTSASILIGVLYAKGTKYTPKNLAETKNIFIEISTCLKKEMETFKLSPPTTEIDTKSRLIWYENWQNLKKFSDELGIEIP